jgi:hypothetical protein
MKSKVFQCSSKLQKNRELFHVFCFFRLVTGNNTVTTYARTGYLGFLRRTEAIGCDGGKTKLTDNCDFITNIYFISEHHDAVFVVGALDETLILRGMRYHPIDIENSVLRAHKKIAEWYKLFEKTVVFLLCYFLQCCIYLDKSSCCGGRTGWGRE